MKSKKKFDLWTDGIHIYDLSQIRGSWVTQDKNWLKLTEEWALAIVASNSNKSRYYMPEEFEVHFHLSLLKHISQ